MFRKSLIIAVFITGILFAAPQKYFVYFEDKGNSEKSNWREFAARSLSERSLESRERLAIPLDWADIPIADEYVERLEGLGIQVVHRLKWFNAVSVLCEPGMLPRIESLPFVKKIEKVKRIRAKLPQPDIKDIIHPIEDSDYGNAYQQAEILGVPMMHDAGYRGEGILIGMLDSGYEIDRAAFDSINAQGRIIAKYDFVYNDTSLGYNADIPDWDLRGYSHGTKTFSCIGANVPGTMVGIAPNASFALAKTEITDTLWNDFERQIEEDNWAAGIQWLDSIGVDIITSSLGYHSFEDSTENYIFEELNGDIAITTVAADWAASRGRAVFNSAGNDRQDEDWAHINTPSDGDSVCSVGATDFAGDIASFSSPGPSGDGRTKPNIAAPGYRVAIWDPDSDTNTTGSGTSFACPIAAGAAALVLQYKFAHGSSTMGGWNLVELLMETADQYNCEDNDFGWGILKIPVASGLRDGIFGQVVDMVSRTPIESVLVTAGGDTALTDARGRFCVYIAPEDTTLSVLAIMEGYFSESISIDHRQSQRHMLAFELDPVVPDIQAYICYPNPFCENITFAWRTDSDRERYAYVSIFTAAGELVRQIDVDTYSEYGHITWDGKNESSGNVAPGIYIAIIQTEPIYDDDIDIETHKLKILCVR